MAGGASASDGTGVSKSVSVSARLFPSRLFGYIFLGNAKKVYFLELGYLSRALRRFFDPQSKAKSPRKLRSILLITGAVKATAVISTAMNFRDHRVTPKAYRRDRSLQRSFGDAFEA
jgi:hypothetical protein